MIQSTLWPLRNSDSSLISMTESSKERRGVRIRLQQPSSTNPTWCWRPDWLVGGESIYGLLNIFQLLNVVSARRVANEFGPQLPNLRKPFARSPILDLNDPSRLQVDRIAEVTGLSPAVVRDGFISLRFPRSGWLGSPHLRWCPECAMSAFHAVMFQLPLVHRCPGHQEVLRDRCPRCHSRIPYKLDGSTSGSLLFSCPSCKADLIPSLRASFMRRPMNDRVPSALSSEAAILELCDRLPTRTGSVLTGPEYMGYRELLMAMPTLEMDIDRFAGFVHGVLEDLANSNGQLQPSASYTQSFATGKRRQHKQGGRTGWPQHLVAISDLPLVQAASLYRSTRRWLSRNFLRGHCRCVRAACRRLWWPVIGSSTSAFCPVAIAFVRWRMVWEGVSVPAMLLSEPRTTPLGLVTWLSSRAPVGSASWTHAVSDWLVAQILGRELQSSFRYLLDQASDSLSRDQVCWSRVALNELPKTGWVCAGKGVSRSPVRLYVMNPSGSLADAAPFRFVAGADSRHLRWHRDCIFRIEH